MAGRRGKSKVERYHDRVAPIYDATYKGRYWELYDKLTWEHLKRYLPSRHGARVLDLGCGTGKWGLKLAKSGFSVTFVDISARMIDAARRNVERAKPAGKTEFIKADICRMDALPAGRFELAVAQGDPISCADSPQRAVTEIKRILAPGAVCVASVDSKGAGFPHYLERRDLEGLRGFIRDGRTRWLAKKEGEDFPLHMFSPGEIRELFESAGFEVLSLIGKPVLPLYPNQELLDDPARFRKIFGIEKLLWKKPDLAAIARHLQVAARKR